MTAGWFVVSWCESKEVLLLTGVSWWYIFTPFRETWILENFSLSVSVIDATPFPDLSLNGNSTWSDQQLYILFFFFKRKIKKFFPTGVFSDKSYGNALTPLQKRMLENKNEWNFPSISQGVRGLQLLGKSSTQSDCFLPPKDKEGVLQLLMNVALVTLTGAGHHSFEQRS